MGVVHHNVIIVTCMDGLDAIKLHSAAMDIFEGIAVQVTNVQVSPFNGYHTFMVGPDGSKERWPDSDEGDERRSKFREYLDDEYSGGVVEAVEVCYGDCAPVIVWRYGCGDGL